ncbi:protein-methionine-sulfoxide reductase heme-binding subunit MsrQ [Ferrovibrio xuzhouensis]|uniref:Protein-methionine-sulfoxide reductase heme-binding subunit MsrQ n=1 Tax=Ferrovibrio xuzhouensis TaxID=1576914 RepID=A0ABV7VAE5_9PROT
MLPWTERNGALSPFKLTCFILLCLPALWLAAQALAGMLGARPYDEAIHQAGQWAVRLILVTLAVTPFRRLLRWPKLVMLRRQIGVAAMCYALLHLTLYTASEAWMLPKVVHEIVSRFYLTIGFVAVLGLVALGITSTDGMIRRMGGRNWQRLHRIVYVIAVLAVVHFLLQSIKRDMTTPFVFMGFLAWELGYRAAFPFKIMDRPWQAAILAVLAGLVAGGLEYGWYAVFTQIPAERVLEANLQFAYRIAPAWWVAGSGLLVAVLAWLRVPGRLPALPRWAQPRRAPPARAAQRRRAPAA